MNIGEVFKNKRTNHTEIFMITIVEGDRITGRIIDEGGRHQVVEWSATDVKKNYPYNLNDISEAAPQLLVDEPVAQQIIAETVVEKTRGRPKKA